jgi:signal peptidase II
MMKKGNKIKMGVGALVLIAVLLGIDQYTKSLAVKILKENGSIPILKNIFELTYVENRGAAFGILQNCQWLFVVLTAVILAVLFWFFFRMPEGRRYLPARLCLAGLAAGAVGNLIDRVGQGYVVDFFYFKLIDFPVFNMADIYVVVTILILAVLILFYYDEDEFSQKQ